MTALGETLAVGRLSHWAGQRGWPTTGWVCDYRRVRPGPEPTEVYGFAHPDGQAACADVAASGAVTLAAAQDDPALPGLPAVLSRLDRPRILRYRPGRRCTLRGDTADGPRIVKVAAEGECHLEGDRRLWAVRATLPFTVAQPCGWDAGTQSAWYAVVPGRPLAGDLLAAGAVGLITRLGTALAGLARAPVVPAAAADPADQLARSRRAADRAARAVPELGRELADVVEVLRAAHEGLPTRALVPVHGAPHPHQWLLASDRLGLIDFDRFALGDPELDLATLLAELAYEPDRVVDLPALTAGARAGYEAGGVPLDDARLRLYLGHKRLAKASRTACSAHPAAARRAHEHLLSVYRGLAAAR